MKTLMFVVVAVFAILTGAQANACQPPNFNKILKEIKQAETISAALEVREKHLHEMCNLEDFINLTGLENEDTVPFRAYRLRLADFILEHIRPFLAGVRFADAQNSFIRDLLPRMIDISQNVRLREVFLPTIESCEDLKLLTASWQANPDKDLVCLLHDLYRRESSEIWNCENKE